MRDPRLPPFTDGPVPDIRTVPPERHWQAFAESWRTLLSYRYLGKTTPFIDRGAEREVMPLRSDMRNPSGGVMAAPLCLAAPEPWWLDDDCVPAPVTMTYAILDAARDVRRIETRRERISIGRTMGFTRSRIVDADDPSRLIALSCGSGVSLGSVPGGFEPVDNPVYELADSPDLPSLRDVFGVGRGDAGSSVIARVTRELASPHGALHIGPINVALEAAATDVLERAFGSDDFQCVHWSVMLVKPGEIGPFVAAAQVVGTVDRPGAVATLVDQGRGGRVVATAQAAYTRP